MWNYPLAITLYVLLLPLPGLSQPTGLLSEAQVRQEAVLIGGFRNNQIHQAIYPDIKFTCPANVSSWTVVAKPVGGGARNLQVHLWRQEAATAYYRYKRASLSQDSPNPVRFVYQAVYDTPIEVGIGDILGLYNPPVPVLTFRYQAGGGSRSYFQSGPPVALETINIDSIIVYSRHDYPLISVEADPQECASMFISYQSLVSKAEQLYEDTSTVQYQDSTQRIIPDLIFPANGEILNITLGALSDLTESTLPEVQVWRRTESEEWLKVASVGSDADVTYNIALNVHLYTPTQPVRVRAGDVLGIHQPTTSTSALRIYLLPDGPINYHFKTNTPLNAINISSATPQINTLPLLSIQFREDPPTSAPPTITSSGGSNVGGIVAAFVCVMVIVAITILVVTISIAVYKYRKGQIETTSYSRARPHRYDITAHVGPQNPRTTHNQTPPTPDTPTQVSSGGATSDQMEYNELYNPQDPSQIITSGKRESLTLKPNYAYSTEESRPPHATNPVAAIYEDV